MRQQLKRVWGMGVVLALLCGLSACSRETSTVQILDDLEEQPEYLSFFSSTSLSGSDVGKYWSDRFAETYNKRLYINYDGAAYYAEEGLSYREILEKRMQSSTPEDLYIINAEDVLEFEKKGYWMDLSGMKFVEVLSEAALYQSTYQGKVFSVPLSFTGFGFYWNVNMLQEHGLTVPENLNEFLNVCETLKADGILPYGANKGYALTVPAMCKGLSKLYQSADQEQRFADLNSGEVPISSYLREGFDFLEELLQKGYLDPQQALETVPGEEWELFLNEECAFICIGLGASLQHPEKNTFQVELTGLPVLPDGSNVVYGADSRLCVNPNSENLETALEFIEMVGTAEALDKSAALDHTMSSAKDSATPVAPTEEKMWELLKRPGKIPNQDFALHFNTWESIRDVSREICGGLSVIEACDHLDERQRTDLEEFSEN